jgi:MFS family permease
VLRTSEFYHSALGTDFDSYIGYAGSAIGNIVANPGFIQVFGTVRNPTTGALELKAEHVSAWGAAQQVAQIVFQLISPFVIDRFGRKMAMYGLTLNVIIVSLTHFTWPKTESDRLRQSFWKLLPRTGRFFWLPKSSAGLLLDG